MYLPWTINKMFTTSSRRFFGFQRVVQGLLKSGKMEIDKSQEFAINYLSNLEDNLESNSSNWTNVFPESKSGAYIYGSAGSGKTMLMDLFYTNIRIKQKSRFHFNQFMLKFYSDLRELRSGGNFYDDPTGQLIRNYCNNMRLLCLDEFQVNKSGHHF